MLHRLLMAGAMALTGTQSLCRQRGVLTGREWFLVPARSRLLTGGETREAARNAKAHLLRVHAVASQVSTAPAAPSPQSNFLDLGVDDRVVVGSLAFESTSVTWAPWLSGRTLLAGPVARD